MQLHLCRAFHDKVGLIGIADVQDRQRCTVDVIIGLLLEQASAEDIFNGNIVVDIGRCGVDETFRLETIAYWEIDVDRSWSARKLFGKICRKLTFKWGDFRKLGIESGREKEGNFV